MLYNNKKYLLFLKNSLMISGLLLLISMSAALFFQWFQLVFALSIVLVLMLILNRALNFSFVRIQQDSNKLMIRYYSLFAVERNYESIEFPVASLRHVTVRKYLLGLKWDLHLTVQLKQGLATYPPVCLSAIPYQDRKKLVYAIRDLIRPDF